ncbi:MAG TPA: A/G-specific adenine glycosylase [Candidatus Limnocylindria bacterium]|nr:A/G-specific adenine glycosylase [Candidatus Limnocylindria bacterium]
MAEVNLSLLRRRLLNWYRKNQRDLPWRRSRDPYAIWISETMLQQTQVKTVLPYYARFLDALPTVQALAGAPLPRVLRLWSGLGYYRRAENLHKAARQIVAHHGGNLPREYQLLRALPGIGDYTAGALLSIAFDEKYPAVDGNVRRVFNRILNTTTEAAVRETAGKLAQTSQPGNLNQALMELGATVCTPKEPRCGDCPLTLDCRSRNRLRQSAPRPRAYFRNVTWPLAIVDYHGKILLRRRQADGLLARLWELPGGEIAATATPEAAIRKELRPLAVTRLRPQRLGELRHSITDRRIHAPVLLYRWPLKQSLPPGWRWIVPTQLHRYPTSSMTDKAIKLFIEHEKSPG